MQLFSGNCQIMKLSIYQKDCLTALVSLKSCKYCTTNYIEEFLSLENKKQYLIFKILSSNIFNIAF